MKYRFEILAALAVLGLGYLMGAAIPAHAETSVLLRGGADDIRSTKYGDTWSGAARVETEVVNSILGSLAVAAEFTVTGDSQHTIYGDLSGVGLTPEIVYRPFDWTISPYALAGYGYYFWNWERSEYLKDAGIEVDLKDSWGRKVAAGVDWKLSEHWAANFEVGYYKADFGFNAHYADGTNAHVIGDSVLGNEGVEYSLGFRYTF